MDVSVMLEHIAENGYRATAMAPTPLTVEAPSRDEVVDRIRALIEERFAGVEWIRVAVPNAESVNPWLRIAGTWQDAGEVAEVRENIEADRRELDADPDRL